MNELIHTETTLYFKVECLLITEENIEKVYEWVMSKNIGAEAFNKIEICSSADEPFIYCDDHRLLTVEEYKIGDYLMYSPELQKLGIRIGVAKVTDKVLRWLVGYIRYESDIVSGLNK